MTSRPSRPRLLASVLGLSSLFLVAAGCVSENAPIPEPLDLRPAPERGVLAGGQTFRLDPSGTAFLESRADASAPRRLVVDLPSALAVVGARSVEVRYAQARVEEARQGVWAAAFSFVPEVLPGAVFRAHRELLQQTTGQFLNVSKQSELGGAGVLAQWDAGGALFRGLAAARRTDAAEAATDTARAQAALAVATGYFDLVRSRALVRIADRAVASARELERDQEAKERRGAGIRADVLQARAEVVRKQFLRSQASVGVATASARLAALLELDPSVELVPSDETPLAVQLVSDDLTTEQLLARAGASRPELRESAALIEAARREHQGTVWGPLVPQVDAGLETGVLGPTFGHSDTTNDYVASFGWKIGPGGLLDFPAMNATAARVQQARLREEGLRVEIAREVVESRAHATAAEQELVSAQEGVVASREALRLVTERFQKGAGIVLEVLDAQRALVTAETDEVEAIVHFDRAQYSLLRAIGEPIVATGSPR